MKETDVLKINGDDDDDDDSQISEAKIASRGTDIAER